MKDDFSFIREEITQQHSEGIQYQVGSLGP